MGHVSCFFVFSPSRAVSSAILICGTGNNNTTNNITLLKDLINDTDLQVANANLGGTDEQEG